MPGSRPSRRSARNPAVGRRRTLGATFTQPLQIPRRGDRLGVDVRGGLLERERQITQHLRDRIPTARDPVHRCVHIKRRQILLAATRQAPRAGHSRRASRRTPGGDRHMPTDGALGQQVDDRVGAEGVVVHQSQRPLSSSHSRAAAVASCSSASAVTRRSSTARRARSARSVSGCSARSHQITSWSRVARAHSARRAGSCQHRPSRRVLRERRRGRGARDEGDRGRPGAGDGRCAAGGVTRGRRAWSRTAVRRR
jgi:hypothetical protein